MKTPRIDTDLAPLYERCRVDIDDFEWWLEQKGWHLRQIERGDIGLTLDEAQLLYIIEDPVLFARAFMDDPDTGQPYEFFDYQVPSVRAWYQDVVHQDGAEVGKTREIVVLVIWGSITGLGGQVRNAWSLVGAPQQTHLDEIIMAVEEHFGVAEGQRGEKPILHHFWTKPKKHPHYMHRFLTLNPENPRRPGISRVYYRPAGYDGEAYRGVHVSGFGIKDEAAKIKNAKAWQEFWRALKPGCHRRIYSVPDGDNTTEYFKICQQAIENLPPPQEGWRKFRWPKTLMPEPFWSAERKREFIRLYGSADAPGYVRNVLGEHGQAENPVWPWPEIEPNICDVPEYRCIKLVADNEHGELRVTAYGVEMVYADGRKSPRERLVADRDEDIGDFKARDDARRRQAIRRVLREFLQPFERGVYWMGADLGFAKDPSELMVWREIGAQLRRVARIHLRGMGYDQQCDTIYCLDELLGFQGAWGVDFGSAGTAVVQFMQALERFEEGSYEERMTGFQFAAAVDAIDEDGNILEEEDERGEVKPVRLPAKELATNLITSRLQRVGMAVPYDNEVVGHYLNHTAREGQRWRIFSKENDHTIDADRAAVLRKVYDELIGSNDVFSSGVNRRNVA